MEQFTVVIGAEKVNFSIEKIKYFFGSDYLKKFSIINKMRQIFSKVSNSEYALETCSNASCLFNGEYIDSRYWSFIEVSQYFDIDTDLKLGAKSLSLKYVEGCLKNIEYDESLNTINILFKDFVSEKVDSLLNRSFDEILINCAVNDLNLKSLLKLLDVIILKKSLLMNQYDMAYDEVIIFQIKLIEKIAEVNINNKYLVTLDIPMVTFKIVQCLKSVKSSNIYVVCVVNNFVNEVEIKDILNFDRQIIDFADDQAIYNNLIMNLPIHFNIDETKDSIKDYFSNKKTDITDLIKGII